MIRVTIAYDQNEQPWSHVWKKALAHGIIKCGDRPELKPMRETATRPSDVTVTWGLRGGRLHIKNRTLARGGRHLVMERGFIGDRQEYTALGFDGIAGRASFPKIDDPSRLARLFPGLIAEWRDARDAAVVMGQVVGDATTKHVDLEKWYQTATNELNRIGFAKVLFRPHPIEHRKKRFRTPKGAELCDEGALLAVLDRCGLVVTFNSTSAVDAVLHGVCVHALDKGSPAYDVASHDYSILRVPREDWAAKLAWHQWSLAEIESGAAWDALRTIAKRGSTDGSGLRDPARPDLRVARSVGDADPARGTDAVG